MCVATLCSCAPQSQHQSPNYIDVYDAEYESHRYIIFEHLFNGGIGVIHDPECKCKTEEL